MPRFVEPATVSVVIPTYNAASWIAEALGSVFDQTLQPIDIIVVDDASTDATTDRVAAASVTSPVPVHLIRLDSNTGSPAPTLNAGVAAARGDFIAVLDHDDVFLPTKLEHQARVLMDDPRIALVFSLFGEYGTANPARDRVQASLRVRRIRRRMQRHTGYYRCDGPIALEEFARSINYVGGFPGFLFRRSAWEQKGGFDERLMIASDYEFLCWLCTQGTVGFVPELHYRKREHGDNLTRASGIQWRLDAVEVLSRYVDFQGTAEMRRVVRSSINMLLLKVAMRLWSSGNQAAARDICATLKRLYPPGWQHYVTPPALRLYAVYFWLRRSPWNIGPEEAARAVRLTHRLEERLSLPGRTR